MVLIIAMGIMNGFDKEFERKLFAMNYPITVISAYRGGISDEFVSKLQNEFSELKMSPYISTQAVLKSGDKMEGALVFGVDFESEKAVNSVLAKALEQSGIPQGFEMIVGKGLSDEFSLIAGEKITGIFMEASPAGLGINPLLKRFAVRGEFYWNTGLFLSNVSYLRKCFCKILPPVLREYDKRYPEFSVETENAYMKETFSSYPNISVDFGILEKPSNVCVMKCDFGWADLGTWHSIDEAMQKGSNDNVIVDSDVLMEDCHNTVVKMPKGKLAVLNGLDGFIVAESDNVLLVCKKEDSSQRFVSVCGSERLQASPGS